MITLQFTGRGIETLAAQIAVLAEAMPEVMTRKMEELASETVPDEVSQDFDSGGRDPYVWDRNAPSTVAKKGKDHPLVDRGRLVDSLYFEVEHPDDETWLMYAASDYTSPRGSDFNIWHRHYKGYTDKRDGVERPARPAGALSDESVEKIMDSLAEAVREKMDEVLVAT